MKIYNYCPQTGEFLSEGVADECQIVKGDFHIPAHATTKKPLPEKQGYRNYFKDGKWIRVSDKENSFIADMVRAQRNALLSATDWSQLSDIPESTREKYCEYRQQLRDITKQDGFPSSVTFPTLP